MKPIQKLGLSFSTLTLIFAYTTLPTTDQKTVAVSPASEKISSQNSTPNIRQPAINIPSPSNTVNKTSQIQKTVKSSAVNTDCPTQNYYDFHSLRQNSSWDSCRVMNLKALIEVDDGLSYVMEIERLSDPLMSPSSSDSTHSPKHRYKITLRKVSGHDPSQSSFISSEEIESDYENLYFYSAKENAHSSLSEILGDKYPSREETDTVCFNRQTKEYERTQSGSLTQEGSPSRIRAELILKELGLTSIGCKSYNQCRCFVHSNKTKLLK